MDPLFDRWAEEGRAERMEEGHGYSARMYLGSMRPPPRFSFLDVGCGNGWALRTVMRRGGCCRAVGIDASPKMIARARTRSRGLGIEYAVAHLEGWNAEPFDVVFSMESLYYAESMEAAAAKVYDLTVPGGVFACGTDYYAENADTLWWGGGKGTRMHLLSEDEWAGLLEGAGFEADTFRMRNPGHPVRWKRERGTLFVTGVRPKRDRRRGAKA